MDDSVLAVYVEPLLVDRAVLFVGDGRSHALERAVSVADYVTAFDVSRDARRRRLSNGTILPYESAELDALDGPFDVVLVPDVRAFARDEFEARLDDLARLAGRRGHVIVGLDTRATALDHEQLWDALAVRFDAVRMAGAAPMHAFAVAELGPTDAGNVVVDGSLISGRAKPAVFVAVAGQTDPVIDEYVLVQVDDVRGDVNGRVVSLEQQLRERGKALEQAEKALGAGRADLERLHAERERILADRDAAREDRRRVEREANEAISRAKRTITMLEEASRVAPSIDEMRQLEERLVEQAERVHDLDAEVERRGRLVRELVEETRKNAGTPHGSVALADPVELDRAIERALRAEAERAELAFKVDELRARLADRPSTSASSAGLNPDVRELSEQVGNLTAQLMLSRERELESRGSRDLARGENLALVAQVAALETQRRELDEHVVTVLGRVGRDLDPGISLESALLAAVDRFERVRGEATGLRLRLDALEKSPARTTSTSDTSGNLRLELDALAAELVEAKSALARASDTSTATRDALVERLQLELAQREQEANDLVDRERSLHGENSRLREAVVDASTVLESNDALTHRIEQLETDLRDALSAAEKAAADARTSTTRANEQAAALVSERARAAALDTNLSQARRTLEETRASLETLRSAAELSESAPRRRSADLESASSELGNRPLDEDKELLLRALTAQLEERDDLVRALERRLESAVPEGAADTEALRREILNLTERSSRLVDELRVEREARRAAEDRAQSGVSTAAAAATRELEQSLALKTSALEQAAARAEGAERDIRTLREVFAETRGSLENLLGAASGSGDPELAARLGDLLTLLGRY